MAKVKLGDFEVTLNGELPEVGSLLPNFLLADGDLNNVDLEQFKGKRLVLNIFPSMNTPVCSASVVQFNNLASDFDNTVVLCISRDLAFGHKQFCINHNLNDIRPFNILVAGFDKISCSYLQHQTPHQKETTDERNNTNNYEADFA